MNRTLANYLKKDIRNRVCHQDKRERAYDLDARSVAEQTQDLAVEAEQHREEKLRGGGHFAEWAVQAEKNGCYILDGAFLSEVRSDSKS